MRQLFLYHLYSGHLFFSASLLFILTALLELTGALRSRPRIRRFNGFLTLLAIPLAALSGTPLPLSLAVPLAASALLFVFLPESDRGRSVRESPARIRLMAGLLAITLAVIALALELPYHARRPDVPRPSLLVVIGDSLSSGGFGESRPWPEILATSLGVPLRNLALPSDTAPAAVRNQLPALAGSGPRSTVVVEIGGNDMIGGESAVAYEVALERIVAAAKRQGSRVLVLELPQIPGTFRFGAAQREVARRHGAVLIPKRLLAAVLSERRNTSDGIHLTQRGHDALALSLRRWLRW